MERSITANGETYCLNHLRFMETQAALELRGGFKKTVQITVSFENHCYTRSVTEVELAEDVYPEQELIQDGSKEDPRPRVFDEERYKLSFQLPSLVQSLITNQQKVYATSHHNVLSAQVITDSNNNYPYVFFMKVSKDKELKKLRVKIESAYPYDPSSPPFSLDKPQSFMKLLSKTWMG